MHADVIVNIGMNAMKHAHNINTSADGKPIKSFLMIPWWWIGIVGIVGGEVGNVVAYGYAPASIVTPMGAVGVLTNVIITTYVLKEPFSAWNCGGVLGVVGGIVMVVYYAPRATIILNAQTMWEDLIWTPQFLAYTVIFVVLLVLFLSIGKQYGERTVFVYIGTCAVIASLTIVSSKTFSSIVAETFATGDGSHWKYPAPYISLVLMVGTAVLSMGYVNTAMMHFGNSVVVPTYYAMFTVASVASVALVYREFDCMTELGPSLAFGFGIMLTVVGVGLLQTGKSDVVRLQEEMDQEDEMGANVDVSGIVSRHEARYKQNHRMPPIQEENTRGSGSQIELLGKGHCSPLTPDTDADTPKVRQSADFLIPTAEAAGHSHLETWPPAKAACCDAAERGPQDGAGPEPAGPASLPATAAPAAAGAQKRKPSIVLEHLGSVGAGEGYSTGKERSQSLDRYSGLSRTPGGASATRTPRSVSREGIAIMSLSGAVLTMPLNRTPSSSRPLTPSGGGSFSERVRREESGSLHSRSTPTTRRGSLDQQGPAGAHSHSTTASTNDQQSADGLPEETPRVSPMPSAPPSPEPKSSSFAVFTPKTPVVSSLINALSIPRANHLPELPFLMMLPAQYVQDFEADSSVPVDASPASAGEGGEAGEGTGAQAKAGVPKEAPSTSLVHRMAAFSPRMAAFSPRLPGLQALHRSSRLLPCVEPDGYSTRLSHAARSSRSASSSRSRSRSRSPSNGEAPAVSPSPASMANRASLGAAGVCASSAVGPDAKAMREGSTDGMALSMKREDVVLSVEHDEPREGGDTQLQPEGGHDAGAARLAHTQISLFPSPANPGSLSVLESVASTSPRLDKGDAMHVEQGLDFGRSGDRSEAVASWAEAARAVAREGAGVVGGGSEAESGCGDAVSAEGVLSGEGSLIEYDSLRLREIVDDVSPLIAPPNLSMELSTLEAVQGEVSGQQMSGEGGGGGGDAESMEDVSVDYDV